MSITTVLDDLYGPRHGFGGGPKRRMVLGGLVARAFGSLACPQFCLIGPGERWFSDHLAKLAGALDREPDAFLAVSGSLVESLAADGKSRRRLETTIFREHWKILHAVDTPQPGRFMFRASLLARLPAHLVACLDGLEHRALAIWAYLQGPLAQSAAASHFREEHAGKPAYGFMKETLQVDMIMDSVRNNAEWSRLAPWLRTPPVDPSTLLSATTAAPIRIKANWPYPTGKGQEGFGLLGEGFSYAEDNRTWIDGKTATMTFALPEQMNLAQQVPGADARRPQSEEQRVGPGSNPPRQPSRRARQGQGP